MNLVSDKRHLKDASKVHSEAASVCLSHTHAHEHEHNPNAKSPFLMKREKHVIGRECDHLHQVFHLSFVLFVVHHLSAGNEGLGGPGLLHTATMSLPQ